MKQLIIFSDLDGTLLDYSTYSFEMALSSIQLLKEKEIPLVISSSKTKKEIEYYRRKLGNNHPFISENGGGIFIPKDYFNISLITNAEYNIEETESYQLIRLGARYSDLRKAIMALQQENLNVRGFGDMDIKEVSDVTGLPAAEAEMAKERDFDEPFLFQGSEAEKKYLLKSIHAKGFYVTQVRFFHILGSSDKGKAVSVLIELYKKKFSELTTIAIGDSVNDLPMFERVDFPIIVQKPDGSYDQRDTFPKLIKANGIGPEGWNNAIQSCIKDLHIS